MALTDKYHQNAVECHLEAQRSTNPLDKQQWLKIAGQWLKLAEVAEQNEADD
jgi:hypothetical protein